MIKSLLGEDEEPKKESKPEIVSEKEKTTDDSEKNVEKIEEVLNEESVETIDTQEDIVSKEEVKTEDDIETIEEIKTAIETGKVPEKKTETVKPFEVNHPIGQPKVERTTKEPIIENVDEESKIDVTPPVENKETKSDRELELERKLAEIEAELIAEKTGQVFIDEEVITELDKLEEKAEEPEKTQKELEELVNNSANLEDKKDLESQTPKKLETEDAKQVSISQKDFVPESKSETMRKSGMAWSAALGLFASIVFMMVLGWFADLLLGSSPWGITSGIILGAIIGFIQFIRITSQIHSRKPNDFERVSLNSNLQQSKPIVETGAKEQDTSDKKVEKVDSDISKIDDKVTESSTKEQ